jgi:hypothetical protein
MSAKRKRRKNFGTIGTKSKVKPIILSNFAILLTTCENQYSNACYNDFTLRRGASDSYPPTCC